MTAYKKNRWFLSLYPLDLQSLPFDSWASLFSIVTIILNPITIHIH
jgi:hypothetical protein